MAGLVVAAGALVAGGAVALEGLQDDENDSLLSRTPFGTRASQSLNAVRVVYVVSHAHGLPDRPVCSECGACRREDHAQRQGPALHRLAEYCPLTLYAPVSLCFADLSNSTSASADPPVDRAVQREWQGGADKPPRTKKRVVILGSGWAAVGVLRELDNEAYEALSSSAMPCPHPRHPTLTCAYLGCGCVAA